LAEKLGTKEIFLTVLVNYAVNRWGYIASRING